MASTADVNGEAQRNAALDREEKAEVLALIPSYKGKLVLDLGPEIREFTAALAKEAGHVLLADVYSAEVAFDEESVDLIFSNGLLMSFPDDVVKILAETMVAWLKPGGNIFFRELCSNQSGQLEQKTNQIHYREPRFYTKIFKECHFNDKQGNSYELSLITCKSLGNQNQICWVWEKVKSQDDKGFQQFLDNVQYKSNGILRYERVFGEGYVSTGGIQTTKEFVAKLNLKTGQKVLDVGCGIGGGDFYMADDFGAHVIGIDLSVNMISLALERAIGRKSNVEFEVADCTKKNYDENTFDVIYSRDTILHIQDKPALFKSFYNWLKPGGKVLISDYCKSEGEPTEEFADYIKQRGYDLHDVKAYGKMLEDAGFHGVVAEDRTNQFLEVLQRELDEVEKNKEAFIHDFSQEDYDAIVNGWKAKLKRSSAGEQCWGLFIAIK